MKKLFLTICLTAMLSTPAMSACDGGTEYTVDGDTFCISNIGLNWWSAANWCKANGMRLATIYEVCPDWNGGTGNGSCGREIGSSNGGYGWTATVSGNSNAFIDHLSSDYLASYNRNDETNRALCTN